MRCRALIILVAVTAGAVAFYAGHSAPGRETTPTWLQGVSADTVRMEQQFEEQARDLANTVRAEQRVLSSMLADPHVADDRVLAQVESVLGSHATLMRSVTEHVAQLRARLPEQERQQLMLSCANSLQGQVQRRYRWRGGAPGGLGDGADDRPGRWGAGGSGFGGGYGRQYRGGRTDGNFGLVRRLGLTEAQMAWAQKQDPNFADECAALRDELRETHMEFAASFADAQVREEEFLQQIDRLIDAHGRLERRVAQHIVQLRPHLSPEQLDRLSGACSGMPGACGDNPALLNLAAVNWPGVLSTTP